MSEARKLIEEGLNRDGNLTIRQLERLCDRLTFALETALADSERLEWIMANTVGYPVTSDGAPPFDRAAIDEARSQTAPNVRAPRSNP